MNRQVQIHDLYKYEYTGGGTVSQPDLQKYQWGKTYMPIGEG